MNSDLGKWIMLAGAFLFITGLAIWLFHDKLNWLGRLPGDVRLEKENFRLYFPITTMILLSALASLLLVVIKKFLK